MKNKQNKTAVATEHSSAVTRNELFDTDSNTGESQNYFVSEMRRKGGYTLGYHCYRL